MVKPKPATRADALRGEGLKEDFALINVLNGFDFIGSLDLLGLG
jgi:hypothetical protein